MTSKKEQQAIDEFHAGRADRAQAEMDKRSHLVNPLTDPSSGDPPPGITPQGDRMGAVPVTRNAIADTAQAEQEGLDAAKKNEPTKAEKASAERQREAARTDRSDRMGQPAGYVLPSEREKAADAKSSETKDDKGKHT